VRQVRQVKPFDQIFSLKLKIRPLNQIFLITFLSQLSKN
jgi:hypothetical protein